MLILRNFLFTLSTAILSFTDLNVIIACLHLLSITKSVMLCPSIAPYCMTTYKFLHQKFHLLSISFLVIPQYVVCTLNSYFFLTIIHDKIMEGQLCKVRIKEGDLEEHRKETFHGKKLKRWQSTEQSEELSVAVFLRLTLSILTANRKEFVHGWIFTDHIAIDNDQIPCEKNIVCIYQKLVAIGQAHMKIRLLAYQYNS